MHRWQWRSKASTNTQSTCLLEIIFSVSYDPSDFHNKVELKSYTFHIIKSNDEFWTHHGFQYQKVTRVEKIDKISSRVFLN